MLNVSGAHVENPTSLTADLFLRAYLILSSVDLGANLLGFILGYVDISSGVALAVKFRRLEAHFFDGLHIKLSLRRPLPQEHNAAFGFPESDQGRLPAL